MQIHIPEQDTTKLSKTQDQLIDLSRHFSIFKQYLVTFKLAQDALIGFLLEENYLLQTAHRRTPTRRA